MRYSVYSDNYRSLSSAVGIVMEKCETHITSGDLQFAFKKGHRTTVPIQCKQTIKYYIKNSTNVYSCMVDASKACDRIRHDKLFEAMLKQDISLVIMQAGGTYILWRHR